MSREKPHVGDYIKTYDLCSGEIKIGIVKNIMDKDVNIDTWMGDRELRYNKEEDYIVIPENTLVWDRYSRRYVFRYSEEGMACFSTIVVQVNPYLKPLIVRDEKFIVDIPPEDKLKFTIFMS